MRKIIKKMLVFALTVATIATTSTFLSLAENTEKKYIHTYNPYYKSWKNNFIIYVDNYSGDPNNVSANDLNSGKGTSRIYTFSKLKDKKYTYDDLLKDIIDSDHTKNLHDSKPILILLPKTAKNFESHAKLADSKEKGKLFTGGPYSKYSEYENGFYYKDEKLTKQELNKLLEDYKKKAEDITKKLNTIKSFSISDLFKNAKLALATNGATSVAGTKDAKIFFMDINKKFSPYNLTFKDFSKYNTHVSVGADTSKIPIQWNTETIYIYDADYKNLIAAISFSDFVQLLWQSQDTSFLNWYTTR